MSYLSKFAARMGMSGSKDTRKKRVDEATSNSSLSNLRYVITEKPKWKVFRKREVVPIPAYQTSLKPRKGCPCGSNGPCKQKVTPKGVTIHYPQKKFRVNAMLYLKNPAHLGRDVITSSQQFVNTAKKTFSTFNNKKAPKSKVDRGYYSTSPKGGTKVKTIRPKKFPTWRLDKISYRPYGPKYITPSIYQGSN